MLSSCCIFKSGLTTPKARAERILVGRLPSNFGMRQTSLSPSSWTEFRWGRPLLHLSWAQAKTPSCAAFSISENVTAFLSSSRHLILWKFPSHAQPGSCTPHVRAGLGSLVGPLHRPLSPALSSAPNKWTTKYSRFQITANYWYELKPNENTWQASFITAFNVWIEVASSSRLMLSVHHERNGLHVVSVCFLVSHSCADSRI